MSTTTEDRRAALEVANRGRFAHADVKREVGAERLSIARALEDPRAASMSIYDLLASQRRWGSVRTTRFLEAVKIGELRRVDSLTHRQRGLLACRCSTGKAA